MCGRLSYGGKWDWKGIVSAGAGPHGKCDITGETCACAVGYIQMGVGKDGMLSVVGGWAGASLSSLERC